METELAHDTNKKKNGGWEGMSRIACEVLDSNLICIVVVGELVNRVMDFGGEVCVSRIGFLLSLSM